MTDIIWLSLADLERTFAGRKPLIRKLVTVFVQTYASFTDDMDKLAQSGDSKAFAVQLHSLKGASASLGAEALRSRIALLEAELKNNESTMQQVHAALVPFWPAVMQNARDILNTLGE